MVGFLRVSMREWVRGEVRRKEEDKKKRIGYNSKRRNRFKEYLSEGLNDLILVLNANNPEVVNIVNKEITLEQIELLIESLLHIKGIKKYNSDTGKWETTHQPREYKNNPKKIGDLRITDDRLFKIASMLFNKSRYKLFDLYKGDLFNLIYEMQAETKQLQTVLALNRYVEYKSQ